MTIKLQVSGATKANNFVDKPNEDAYILDEQHQIYIVADGVTRDRLDGKYPNPSPAQYISQLFVKEAYQYLLEHHQQDNIPDLLKQAITHANNTIFEQNKDYTESVPSTVAIVAMVQDNQLYYAYIGDSSVYSLILGEKVKRITSPQTKLVHEHHDELTSAQIRDEIANNPSHPYAYGVLNGDERALLFVEYHQLELISGLLIMIASDGFDDWLEWSDFIYNNQSVDELIAEAEAFGVQNPHLRSDDKTAIYLKVL